MFAIMKIYFRNVFAYIVVTFLNARKFVESTRLKIHQLFVPKRTTAKAYRGTTLD